MFGKSVRLNIKRQHNSTTQQKLRYNDKRTGDQLYIWSIIRRQTWVEEAMVAFRADEKQDHACLLPLRLILIEYGADKMVVLDGSP